MTTFKLWHALLIASATTLGSSAAFADTEHDAFFHSLNELSPLSAKVLRAVGVDYRQKCSVEPTVDEYKYIATNSHAFALRLAVARRASGDVDGWSPEERKRYEEFMRELDCPKAQ